jgi:4-aminobutyrate aminotransferase
MAATEFCTAEGKPDKPTAKAVVHACEERKLMLLTCGTYDNVIRWIPPLIVTAEQVEDAVIIFTEALNEVLGS